MIPLLVEAGYRVIAPDLIGFGKSDKFDTVEAYSYHKHVDWLLHLVLRLDLQNITLVCQDWGSLLGIGLTAEHPDRFKQIIAANTFCQRATTNLQKLFYKGRPFHKLFRFFRRVL